MDSFMWGVFPVMFSMVFILIFVVTVVTLIKGASEWNRNNNSPRLTVQATVVAKRENVRRHHATGCVMSRRSPYA